ncbi:unnamed protein product [Gongylonema pulchrum]|uniref:Uncharacterized protein n=1 Tax=Gongylonema pulchrum TaxID=637853 RepID=A0A3P6QLV9_9BILA|nr:unnamed protein product [Gongylonema pulchrum]
MTATRRLSTAPAQIASFLPYSGAPPPKPPRTDRAVLSSLKKRKEREIAAATAASSDTPQSSQGRPEPLQQAPVHQLVLEEGNTLQKRVMETEKVTFFEKFTDFHSTK